MPVINWTKVAVIIAATLLAGGVIVGSYVITYKAGGLSCKLDVTTDSLDASEKARKDYEEIERKKPSDADTVGIANRMLQRTVRR